MGYYPSRRDNVSTALENLSKLLCSWIPKKITMKVSYTYMHDNLNRVNAFVKLDFGSHFAKVIKPGCQLLQFYRLLHNSWTQEAHLNSTWAMG